MILEFADFEKIIFPKNPLFVKILKRIGGFEILLTLNYNFTITEFNTRIHPSCLKYAFFYIREIFNWWNLRFLDQT